MRNQSLLKFLILCVTLSQGFASLPNNGSLDLSDHLVRQKRVIDRTPHANTRVRRLRDVNYVVHVQKYGFHSCGGSILSSHVIITVANCVHDHATYSILFGSLSRTAGTTHEVYGILFHPQFVPNVHSHNVALLSIQEPIPFGLNLNQPITIYNGIVPANSIVKVSGWGHAVEQRSGISCITPGMGRGRFGPPNALQSITMNTININECRALHEGNPEITNDLMCTFHEDKFCGPEDDGNPLVFQGRLAGMLVLDGFLRGPDVYVNVALPAMKNWIHENMYMNRIPRYVPHPHSPSPPRHNHWNRRRCSLVHPCDSDSDNN